ncbi:hypothetical protein BpHYR1_037956 [Brachionus plicatilis]|uniref:RNA-directed DNA polymerase from mobile element jockey-like n=1 Tax=Brachionus plicatilis TaxID=10195 RepID=A0A3M7QET3_BRAPC|nr:hypothetical protein BpHYR1_037956 [Brachionus plicatilis]
MKSNPTRCDINDLCLIKQFRVSKNRVIREWNSLPKAVISGSTVNQFKNSLEAWKYSSGQRVQRPGVTRP